MEEIGSKGKKPVKTMINLGLGKFTEVKFSNSPNNASSGRWSRQKWLGDKNYYFPHQNFAAAAV